MLGVVRMHFSDIKKLFEDLTLSDEEIVASLSNVIPIKLMLYQHNFLLEKPFRAPSGETLLHLAINTKRLDVLKKLKILPSETPYTLSTKCDILITERDLLVSQHEELVRTSAESARIATIEKEIDKHNRELRAFQKDLRLYSTLYFERFLNASCSSETSMDQSLNRPPVRQDASAIMLMQSWGAQTYRELIAVSISESEKVVNSQHLSLATNDEGKVEGFYLDSKHTREFRGIVESDDATIALIRRKQWEIEGNNPFIEMPPCGPKSELEILRIERGGIFRLETGKERQPFIFTMQDIKRIFMDQERVSLASGELVYCFPPIEPHRAVEKIVSKLVRESFYWTWENLKHSGFFKAIFDFDWYDEFCSAMVHYLPTEVGHRFLNRSATSINVAMGDLLALKTILTNELVASSDRGYRDDRFFTKTKPPKTTVVLAHDDLMEDEMTSIKPA